LDDQLVNRRKNTMKKPIPCGVGVDVDEVAGWLGSREDSSKGERS
jgi:hypothetical protein